MSAIATPERLAEIERAEVPAEPVARTATARKMFKYSDFIDVGEGAIECEHARDGQCQDIEHFHCWIRLPNPYQHQDIRKKGLAAKARKVRALRDPESDDAVVLDSALAEISDSIYLDTLVDELLAREWAEDYIEAQTDVSEREGYETIAADREEYARLDEVQNQLPTAEQTPEYVELRDHMDGYLKAIEKRLEETQRPKRDELASRPYQAIVALVRQKRVDEEGDRAFIETYNAWTWFVGTFHVELHPTLRRPHKPMWDEIGHRDRPSAGSMFGEAPEVIDALKESFNELQIALQRGSAGN